MAHPSIIAATERYHPLARLLHWAVAVLVLVAFPLGAVIKFVKDDVKMTFYLLHESIGFVILWLMLARLAFRLIRRPPEEVPMPAIFARTAAVVHTLLYAALIAQPIFGFLANSANGYPLIWFGLFEIAPITPKNADLARLLLGAHVATGWAILVLFLLHIGGVVFHHVLRRDATLYRMI